MPIFKVCSRCGRRIRTGTECTCTTKNRLQYQKYYDVTRRDKKAREFYASARWKKCREIVLNEDKIDVFLYMTSGIVVPADMVHHIIPFKDDPEKALQRDNLMALSSGTHRRIEFEYEKRKREMEAVLFEMNKQFREKMSSEKPPGGAKKV